MRMLLTYVNDGLLLLFVIAYAISQRTKNSTMEISSFSIVMASMSSLVISKIWQELELYYYGEVQVRKVDDYIIVIIMVLAFLTVFFAQKYVVVKKENKELKQRIGKLEQT